MEKPSRKYRVLLLTGMAIAVTSALIIITTLYVNGRGSSESANRAGPGGSTSASGDTASSPSGSNAPTSPAPSASRTPGPKTTGPAGGSSGAAANPAGAFPGAANTGVPAGKVLKTSSPLRINKAGTVIDGVDIRGSISVEANNVTIRNSRIVNTGDFGIIQREGFSGLVVENSEIRGDGKSELTKAIFNPGKMVTLRRSNISQVSDGIDTQQGLIEDNYFHGALNFPGVHIDMIQHSGGPKGTSITIRHNTIINPTGGNSAVALSDGDLPPHDALVENNLMGGGGYTIYAGGSQIGTPYNVRILNNVFTKSVYPKGGYYDAVAHWDGSGAGNVWSGNVWQDTGAPVLP